MSLELIEFLSIFFSNKNFVNEISSIEFQKILQKLYSNSYTEKMKNKIVFLIKLWSQKFGRKIFKFIISYLKTKGKQIENLNKQISNYQQYQSQFKIKDQNEINDQNDNNILNPIEQKIKDDLQLIQNIINNIEQNGANKQKNLKILDITNKKIENLLKNKTRFSLEFQNFLQLFQNKIQRLLKNNQVQNKQEFKQKNQDKFFESNFNNQQQIASPFDDFQVQEQTNNTNLEDLNFLDDNQQQDFLQDTNQKNDVYYQSPFDCIAQQNTTEKLSTPFDFVNENKKTENLIIKTNAKKNNLQEFDNDDFMIQLKQKNFKNQKQKFENIQQINNQILENDFLDLENQQQIQTQQQNDKEEVNFIQLTLYYNNTMTNVLIFGSGYIVVAIVDYLKKKKDLSFTIATRTIDEAKKIAKQLDFDIKIEEADVTDEEKCREITKKSDIVISMVPPSLHKHILDYCIKEKKHLAVASYLNDELRSKDKDAQDANISCLFEVGLDPGIDHIVTMHMINEVKKNKGKVQSLLSLCGGLVAPHCITNPLCYKSSWSVEGPFKALSDAKFLKDGKEMNIKREDLLYNEQFINVNNSICTYYYANRDSTKYKKIYDIEETKDLYRGTIRFKGFVENVAVFLDLGLLEQNQDEDVKDVKILDFIKDKIKDEEEELQHVSQQIFNEAKQNMDKDHELNLKKFANFVTKNKKWKEMDDKRKTQRLSLIFEGFEKLELFSENSEMKSEKTRLTSFINFLSKFLKMEDGETDFILMLVDIESSYDDGRKEKQKFYLQTQGNPNKYSAMSKYVGYPCAMAIELILDGTIDRRGVFGPFTEDVYNPLYNKLVEENMIDPVSKKTFEPKL